MPKAIRVNMLGERFRIDVHARWKKGHAHHCTMGVASAN
jgi:hypothetical protein